MSSALNVLSQQRRYTATALWTIIKGVIEFFLHQHIAKPRVAVELIKPEKNIAQSAEPLKAQRGDVLLEHNL